MIKHDQSSTFILICSTFQKNTCLIVGVIINGCHQPSPCCNLSYKDIDGHSDNYFKFNQELNSRTNSSGKHNCWVLWGDHRKEDIILRGLYEGQEEHSNKTWDSSVIRIFPFHFPPSFFMEVPFICHGPRQCSDRCQFSRHFSNKRWYIPLPLSCRIFA